MNRTAIIFAAALAVTTAGCERGNKETAPAPSERPAIKSVRITMAALHQAGGVPLGWRFTVPPGNVEAGRRTFVDAGCPSCHRVAGEPFPPPTGPGPDLTGMGSHHPAAYFVESILTPIVGVPFAYDQFSLCARVERLGVGVRVPVTRRTRADFAAILGRILADDALARRASEAGRRFGPEPDGAELAADAIGRASAGVAPPTAAPP